LHRARTPPNRRSRFRGFKCLNVKKGRSRRSKMEHNSLQRTTVEHSSGPKSCWRLKMRIAASGGQEAYVAIEDREAANRPSSLADASDALRRRITDQPGKAGDIDAATEADIEDALDQKALEDGVTAADDTAQIVWGLTPHNL
jgi:hypothetical protein